MSDWRLRSKSKGLSEACLQSDSSAAYNCRLPPRGRHIIEPKKPVSRAPVEEQVRIAPSYACRTYAAGSTIAPHSHSHANLTIVLGGSYEEAIVEGRHEAPGELAYLPGRALSKRLRIAP
jgi:hypothetical protein